MMYIIGYSGLHDAISFKKNNLKGLTKQEYRISQGMDSAAALLNKGKIIAAVEEERFTGIKHTENFPINAINFCLDQAGLKISDIDYICHGFNYFDYQSFFQQDDYSNKYYQQALDPTVQKAHLKASWPNDSFEKKFVSVKHHAAHAASAFYPSGFSEALVIVVDGMGELDSISIYHGRGNQLHLLQSYDLLSSIGMLYSIITYHLGFSINSGEYKVMGLAPYGNSAQFEVFFSECVALEENGEILIRGFTKNKSALDWETYRGFREWLTEKTFPARNPDEPLQQHHHDLAASMQAILNKSLLHLCAYWAKATGLNQFCYAGGVALNCTANGVLYRNKLFKEIYIQPAAGDAGTSLGSALYHYRHNLNQVCPDKIKPLPFFGPTSQIEKVLDKDLPTSKNKVIKLMKSSPQEMSELAADWLTQGKIIAWVQGKLEFGPRALGHRSILADPRNPDMREKINRIVKKREGFRPFAPSVKKEKAHLFFDIEENEDIFSTMLFVVTVREEFRDKLPAITHVDGTARIQTVDKSEHLLYWQLLDDFEHKTNVPILLNTSFNVRGQPMIASSHEALSTFADIEIDALFIENYIYYKTVN